MQELIILYALTALSSVDSGNASSDKFHITGVLRIIWKIALEQKNNSDAISS